MLNENDVVNAVCEWLVQNGYQVDGRSYTAQHGVDIVARKSTGDAHELLIEAKGATSSKEGTARFGQPFTDSQQLDHVAKALFECLRVYSQTGSRSGVIRRPGIALAETRRHLSLIEGVWPALKNLGIVVFWVKPDGKTVVME